MISNTLTEKIESLDAILSVEEVANFFSLQPLTIYRMIYRKELDAYKDDDEEWCITRADVRKYCSKNSNL
jgi:excisionase family DNA binding protein